MSMTVTELLLADILAEHGTKTVQHTEEPVLVHYGVKGMRWGHRKSDDTGSGDSGSGKTKQLSEKQQAQVYSLTSRAAKTDIRITELKAELDSLPTSGSQAYRRKVVQSQVKDYTKVRDDLNKQADDIRKGKMTPTQKNLLMGGLLVGGLFAAGYMSMKVESGEFNSFKLHAQARMRGEKFDFKRNEAFKNAKTADDVHKLVVPGMNPDYDLPGGVMNCRRNSMAYELRRRGYDVSATPTTMGMGQSETGLINALTPGQRNVTRTRSLSQQVVSVNESSPFGRRAGGITKQVEGDIRKNLADRFNIKDASNPANVLKALSSQPSGARGEIVFNFGGFGHSMSYEKFGDKFVVFDTQKGARYDVTPDGWAKMQAKWGQISDGTATRLDNQELDKDFLARWVTNNDAKSVVKANARTSAAREAREARQRDRDAQPRSNQSQPKPTNRTRPEGMDPEIWRKLMENSR